MPADAMVGTGIKAMLASTEGGRFLALLDRPSLHRQDHRTAQLERLEPREGLVDVVGPGTFNGRQTPAVDHGEPAEARQGRERGGVALIKVPKQPQRLQER